MVMWPSYFIMLSHSSLYALLAVVAITAEALRGTTATNTLPASTSVPVSALQDLRHALYSALLSSGALIRQRYQRIIQGQLNHLDMVQLLAACSIIHGIRLWRRRSQREESEIREAGPADHKTTRERDLGAGSQSGKFPHHPVSSTELYEQQLTICMDRCRPHRPWLAQETFDLQVLHHIHSHLSFDTNFLQTPFSS